MSLSAVVTAALPIPITSFRLIPMYKSQATLFSTYTSLFCFLTLGFIFYCRHALARLMFPAALARLAKDERTSLRETHRIIEFLPLCLIVLSLLFVFGYHLMLDSSIDAAARELHGEPIKPILDLVPLERIPFSYALMALYLGIFLCAESAFILMAIREYLQDLLKLSDVALILRGRAMYSVKLPRMVQPHNDS